MRTDMTVEEFDEALKEPYAWPGGYPRYFITSDGEALSYEAAREEAEQIRTAIREKSRDGWRVVAVDVNWEDPALYCCHTNDRIESAYAEDDAEPRKVRCPDSADENGIVGCGHEFEACLDAEGFVDCPKCGIHFQPAHPHSQPQPEQPS